MTEIKALERLKICLECGDCLTCEEHDEAIKVAINALQTTTWISVKDKLPDKAGDYLVCYDNGIINIRLFVSECDCWIKKPYQMVITHWMPLPKLPKEV